ncbi:hypothetical protein LRR80_06561 [Streptomyces sp. RO-S4]|nr:hypothetical protein [Streptomyces sp. RO-S4]
MDGGRLRASAGRRGVRLAGVDAGTGAGVRGDLVGGTQPGRTGVGGRAVGGREAVSPLFEAGSAVGAVRGDVTRSTLLRALGGIRAMRATEGWLAEARQITALLFDGLRHAAPRSA